MIDLKAIKARHEQLNKPEFGAGDIWKKIGLCCELVLQDLPDCTKEIERLRGLLKVAKCPNCDGSGGIPHQVGNGEWEQEQCQWCDEVKALEAE